MKLILFDLDGTLIYSGRRDSLCFAMAYEMIYQRKFPSIDWSHYPHVTDTVIFETVIQEHFSRKPEQEEVKVFETLYMELLSEGRKKAPGDFKEVPGARNLIEYLSEQEDVSIAVATGGWKRPAELKLQHVGIRHDVFPISGADGQYNRESIIQEAIRLTELPDGKVTRMVYIGDAIWDVHTTRNLKMNFLGIRYRRDFDILKSVGALHVLGDYLDQELFLKMVLEAKPPV